ncbi:MAG TPA: tyrosine-type recombinase/integrase [Pirellulales bacterium]|jgi:integrase/recombinase XerC|nr:tyrosine-type recombinase/integrase [Pirellulales bacterium]
MMTELIPVPTSALATDDTVRRLLDDFLAGLKPNTLRTYRQGLADFASFVGAADANDAAGILLAGGHGEANHLALAYRANMVERDLSANTINNRLAAIRSLVKLARTLGMIGWAIDVGNVKARPYRDTAGCGATGYRLLLEYLDRRANTKTIRDRAIVRLLFERALRRNEVASLDVAHLDVDAGTIGVLGKGHTDRETLTLPEPTRRALADWLAIRGNEPGPLFINLDRARKGTGRLTGAGIFAIVTALGDATGQRVRPHGLRHAAITKALDATGGDVRAVQKFSRHAKVDTVLVYDDARRDLGGDVAKLVAGN